MHSDDLHSDDCFALRQASRHISKLYERHLSEAGITSTQFSILRTLGRRSSLTMAELAKAMVMDRTTLVRALQPLFRRGFVAVPAQGQGNRRLHVELTSSGLTKLDEAAAHWAAAQASFERSFGPQQAAHLRSELFRMTSEVSDR
ncbi:MarR family transcriptional regulator [Paraburkholderia ginsengiterrae]|uniref:MarR family transcriptional regulator n=1 Tax=Paraburkholderia ginsengiterrae TaxID=1462993 RepID=A0A1A9N9C9_9BURK|nr:MarR family transcriptional regulator [Paraburkholderia ginsengiterrae]OAJ54977.1 MarR family transcriptional regulator [Paraburkholderia ginsengiterrae]OAJ61160.1 MarR family transcriptional regulator [Paraburkholderia ginsengiterrae]